MTALSAVIESTFQSAVIKIQIYKKVSVNHQNAALKQTHVMHWRNVNRVLNALPLLSFTVKCRSDFVRGGLRDGV